MLTTKTTYRFVHHGPDKGKLCTFVEKGKKEQTLVLFEGEKEPRWVSRLALRRA